MSTRTQPWVPECAPAQAPGTFARAKAWLAQVRARLASRRLERRALGDLASMSTRELRDIGIEAADLYTLGVHPLDGWPR